ncbi:MAG: ATP-binding cassette domain-containing protein [Sedimentisphaerales bacterium]|nr:ATP-binding cassette domain-containing protein [Sedimentisphaerales bacterium]
MKSFKRLLGYVWPQWHRLAVIGISAVLIGGLFALSIGTVLPLLKVMMNEEGLHGWVDRLISQDRYGLRFHVPDKIDLSDPNNPNVLYHLRITRTKEKSPAAKAGLQNNDLIVGVTAGLSFPAGGQRVYSAKLLEQLAVVGDHNPLSIRYQRLNPMGRLEFKQTRIMPAPKPFYADLLQRAVSVVPRQQSRDNARDAVIFIILMMAVVTAIRCAARFYQDYTVKKVVDTVVARVREDMFEHALEMPVGFFDQQGSSNALSRIINDTTSAAIGINVIFGKALREPLKALGMIVVAMLIDFRLTLIFLCVAPVSLYAITRLGKKIKRATKKTLQSWAIMLAKLRDVMGAVKIVKVYNNQGYENDKFSAINKKLLRQQFRVAKFNAITPPILETLGMIAGSVGLIYGAQWVYENKMEASEFFAFLIALGATAESLRKISDVWNKIQQANAAAERVYHVIDQETETEKEEAFELEPLKDKIEFRNIVFSYPGAERAALNGVNLIVQAGHNIAIVGPNGSGKTTLANLIPRFYDPDNGQVLIDGKDIRSATFPSLRSQIGMVTQNVVVFNDTVAANIAYGTSDATREQIVQAAKRSFADEFIQLLPDGYETVIGESGTGLSGGQLQRIVIARAILRNPSILIFDEATSQVDADSEAKIHSAIEQIMHQRTSFIIAHRFSTIISADLIVVMDGGRIIASGQHEELMQQCPLYQSLYETQMVKI